MVWISEQIQPMSPKKKPRGRSRRSSGFQSSSVPTNVEKDIFQTRQQHEQHKTVQQRNQDIGMAVLRNAALVFEPKRILFLRKHNANQEQFI